MIQKLIGERSAISMTISVVLAAVVLMFSLDSKTDSTIHWLVGSCSTFPTVSKVLSISVLLGLSLLYRDLQGRMKVSLKRGYFQPLLLALFATPLVVSYSFNQIAGIGLVTLGIMMLLSTHRIERPESTIQRAGIAIGAATLLCPQLIWSIPVCLIMGLRLRQRTWRKAATLILGFFFPFVMVFTFLLAVNWHGGKLQLLLGMLRPETYLMIGYKQWIPAFSILALVLYSPMGTRFASGLIPIREMELFQTQLIWIAGFVLLGLTGMLDAHVALMIAAVPLSALSCIGLEHASKWWVPDLVVIVLLSAFLLR